MSPLACFLALILTASILYLFAAGAAAGGSKSSAVRFKRVVTLYAAVVAVSLGWMIHYFVGWQAQGSPLIPKELQRRVAHTGYYFARDGELTLRGRPAAEPARREDGDEQPEDESSYEVGLLRQLMPAGLAGPAAPAPDAAEGASGDAPQRGFVNGSLLPGESITLKPAWEGDRAAKWNLTYKVNSRPLRLRTTEDGTAVSRCINVPGDRWLNPGDAIFIKFERGGETRFISVRWDAGSKWWPFDRTTNTYRFSQGVIKDDAAPPAQASDLLVSERVLTDGIVLSDLLRGGRKEFREKVGLIDQEWWGVLGGITLVREVRGRVDSRVGVLVADELFQQPDLKIYRRSSGGLSQPWGPRGGEASIQIPTAATVAYGLQNRRNSFELALTDQVVRDDAWGQVVYVNFTQPKAWQLPPSQNSEPFIITSSNDYIPLDGYFIDIGNSSHSFYAKARLRADLEGMSINDGRNAGGGKGAPQQEGENRERQFALGAPASLGDYEQGVLIALLPTLSGGTYSEYATRLVGAPYLGLAATVLVALNFISFIYLTIRRGQDRLKLFLAWSLVWGAALTLLCVRLILAYRVGLVPPLDASRNEVIGIFHKGVDYSLCGLFGFFLVTTSLFFARNRPHRPARNASSLTPLVWLWAALVIVYAFAGGLLGTNQSFGIRISIATHLLLVCGLALLAGRVFELSRRGLAILMAAVILAALALQILFVQDAGSVIYSLSLLFCVGILWGWLKPRSNAWDRLDRLIARRAFLRRRQRWLLSFISARGRQRVKDVSGRLFGLALAGLPLTVIAALLIMPHIIQTGWLRKAVRPALPETTFYRFASFMDSEDVILTTKSGDEEADMSKLLDNSRQTWQMLLYASHGATSPAGYGQAPPSKIGMTYATSVSDCAFSSYVLAEHGGAAALMLLSFYALIACVCVLACWHLGDGDRHRSVALLAAGAFFACNAIYMAGANIGLFVFTGQNLPLLGLNSGGDVLQGLTLAWLAGWLLLATDRQGTPREFKQKHPVAFTAGLILIGMLAVGLVSVYERLGNVRDEKAQDERAKDERSYQGDHDFKREMFDQIERDLPPESPAQENQRNAPLVLRGDKLERAQGGQITEIEEQYRKQFNERVDKFNPNSGLYYLTRARGESGASELRVRVNRRFFYARSPFRPPIMWPGRILAGGESEPNLYMLNTRLMISLRERGYPASVDLTSPAPVDRGPSALLREGNRQFCELRREGDQLRIDPLSGPWSVYLDGQKITSASHAVLDPLSIVVIEDQKAKYRRNLIYLGMTPPVLAYARWRNGEMRRMFPAADFPLAFYIGKAADQALEAQAQQRQQQPGARKLGSDLTLHVDIRLQQDLEKEVSLYARSHPNYSPFRLDPNRLAVTVLDAFSGSVLALPSWPLLDPSNPEYETLINRVPEPTRSRFEGNHNLAQHVAGSTLKPLVFSAMSTALRPAGIDLAQAKVYNRADAFTTPEDQEPPEHPHLRVGGIKFAPGRVWDCNSKTSPFDMQDFIVHSRDFPEGLIGMMGMITDVREVRRVLAPNSASPDISLGGRDYALDLTRASEDGTAFTLQDQREGKAPTMRGPEVVNSTILFRSLASVFDFDGVASPEDRLRRSCGLFLPSFNNPNLQLNRNNYLDNIIPLRTNMGGGSFQDVRDVFISCLLGGGWCEFNNVMMAEAGARLATGQRVFASLEGESGDAPAALPAPLGNEGWRTANIIEPMRMVGEVGTAKDLRPLVALPAQYRVIYKTGTILEGKEKEGRESETLMFILGRWDRSGFVRGKTVAGYLYMEKSKAKESHKRFVPDTEMKKFKFAAPILNILVKYLESADG